MKKFKTCLYSLDIICLVVSQQFRNVRCKNQQTNDQKVIYENSHYPISDDHSGIWSNYQYNWGILAIFWLIALMIVIIWIYCTCMGFTKVCTHGASRSKVIQLYPELKYELYIKNEEPTVDLPIITYPFVPSTKERIPFEDEFPKHQWENEPFEGGFMEPRRIKAISKTSLNYDEVVGSSLTCSDNHTQNSPSPAAQDPINIFANSSFTYSNERNTVLSTEV